MYQRFAVFEIDQLLNLLLFNKMTALFTDKINCLATKMLVDIYVNLIEYYPCDKLPKQFAQKTSYTSILNTYIFKKRDELW